MTKTGAGWVYVILMTSLLHIVWTVLLVWTPAAGDSNPIAGVINVAGHNRPAACAVLSGTALLALVVVRFRNRKIPPVVLALGLLPQQFVLLISALSGIEAAWRGSYADGTPRAWQFITGDQLPIIVIALLYTTAILAVLTREASRQ